MLKKVRIALAIVFFVGITLLFLDFTGTIHAYLGWMAKIQFLPAALAFNFGILAGLVLLTIVFGRIYCSVICPLGVMQDIFFGIATRKKKYRYGWKPERRFLRRTSLIIFLLLIVTGMNSIAAFVAPYSAYGRIASSMLAPLYALGNNVLAYFAERANSYTFYKVDVWIKSLPVLIVAALTLIGLGIAVWKGGRIWCNTICPVGTILGAFSRISLFKIKIDTEKCKNCGLCARACKGSCINAKEHEVDGSRCVVCMDCIGHCRSGAIKYTFAPSWKKNRPAKKEEVEPMDSKPMETEAKQSAEVQTPQTTDNGRRAFIVTGAMLAGAAAVKAQQMKTDGGFAPVVTKEPSKRKRKITPAGSLGHEHFYRHCTACGLCIAACPNGVLRPSSTHDHFMQPEMSFERGYCPPGCTKCSEVCPVGAFHKVSAEERSSMSIGYAVVNLETCVVNTDEVKCGNCARHCPAGAIRMTKKNPDDEDSLMIPVVNPERCIGCGACEHLCPVRPLSAIHVEGYDRHYLI